jgi:hypothetical protein
LTIEQLAQAGVFYVAAPDGRGEVACHPQGDQYAADILAGVIAIADAIAREVEAERKFVAMEGHLRERHQ